jgi:protoporphyrinogen oxidase
VLEAGPAVGGLAGSFTNDHGVFPLGYHHILQRDRTLLYVFGVLGLLDRVRWRRVRMLFHTDGAFYDLGRLGGFLRYPMPIVDKLAFARLMLRCFAKSDWRDWESRSAAELVDAWGAEGLRRRMFEPLARIKFELPAAEVSGAWLGARLHCREGSSALGYIPGTNWTLSLCEGLARLCRDAGVAIRTGSAVREIVRRDGATIVRTADGGSIPASFVVSSIPTEHYTAIAPDDATPEIRSIRYTAITSGIYAVRGAVPHDFYWANILSPGRAASGVFSLDALNPSLGRPGFRYLNYIRHSGSRESRFFRADKDASSAAYREDHRALFGSEMVAEWEVVNKVSLYSPVLHLDYKNPPLRSTSHPEVFFAGNYRTFPSIVSTGTAMASGFETAAAMLAIMNRASPELVTGWRRSCGDRRLGA